MLRFIFSFIISATVARWVYQETALVAPFLKPAFEKIADATEIPTHDQWSKDSLEQIFQFVGQVTQKFAKAASQTNAKRASVDPARPTPGTDKLRALAESLTAPKV